MSLGKLQPLAVAVLVASALPAIADHTDLDPLVVTAPNMEQPLTVTTDPKAPRQPIPAHDGADLLKNIPGFSVIRKGGTDGDPVFRGMAASRLSILLDGETILGGCGNRMDPPTAYVFPESFDSVTVLKGPQSVKHGPGNSAGVVMFERSTPDFFTSPVHGYVSVLGGSFGRNDQVAQLQGGGEKGYVEINGTRSQADDYRDGNGDKIHSNYERYSGNTALGFTPNRDTKIELTAAKSDGEAAYADRSMDGSKFDRTNLGLSYSQKDLSPLVSEVKAKIYRNYVDHVMDNYSLRTVTATQRKMVSNPDRDTLGGNIATTLTFDKHLSMDFGADYQQNQHTFRSAMAMMPGNAQANPDYSSKPRTDDMNFNTAGLYTEAHYHFPGEHGIHAGLRVNKDEAEDQRAGRTTSGQTDTNWLTSGFARYEHQLDKAHRAYAGLGHSQRAADFWERTRSPGGTASTFNVNPEKVTQLDVGLIHSGDSVRGSISTFYTYHDDYILIEKVPTGVNARNIRATTYGAEADAAWQFAHHWTTDAALSLVRGENLSDNRALGQIPAHELRLGLTYDNGLWSAGALGRFVNEQDRVALGQGNIVGQDISETSGFAVFSLNAGYRIQEKLIVTAGVDNLFDKNYAEHLSKGDANVLANSVASTKVNELGRNMWMKVQYSF